MERCYVSHLFFDIVSPDNAEEGNNDALS